ncbi:MAG: shikimate dehydrogenase [Bacteroidales bacterium]|jgi:shikimate dehydrogenase|nr:shikimate dehydrogenase [Bacteroidales bacterium]
MDTSYVYGLIGYPLSHSFSQRYFTEKFAGEGLCRHTYCNFPVENISRLEEVLQQHPDLAGFNVTIPYKEQIIPYLDELDEIASKIGAVNTVRILRQAGGVRLQGFNTDAYGFKTSLEEWYASRESGFPKYAFILGTGGASKAVEFVLRQLSVTPHFVSRKVAEGVYKTYGELNHRDFATHLLVVNTSPLGMYPHADTCPDIPYDCLNERHFLYDLVYNPEETLFMRRGKERGAAVHNGERMLRLQADKAWEIWTMGS